MKNLCVVLLLALVVFGGSEKKPLVDDLDSGVAPADVVVAGAPSEVSFVSPKSETGTTHAFYAQGTFNTLAHDSSDPFEFTMDGKLNYRLRLTFKPFVKDDWCINPLMDVTNDTDEKMFVMYYAAFFDKENKLVGCCSQEVESEPTGKPLQVASLVISGPKQMLSIATHFKLAVYESNKRIGVETLSADAKSEVTKDGKVASELTKVDQSVSQREGYKELRIRSPLNPSDPNVAKNTHVRIEGTTKYTFYLSMSERNAVIVHHSMKDDVKRKERYVHWKADFNFDPVKRVKGCYARTHAVLLNEEDQLVACTQDNKKWSLPAPQDALLSANQLELVTYEFQK